MYKGDRDNFIIMNKEGKQLTTKEEMNNTPTIQQIYYKRMPVPNYHPITGSRIESRQQRESDKSPLEPPERDKERRRHK